MSYYNTNEDLYVKGRRLHQAGLSYTGVSPEYEAAQSRWVDFFTNHPQIAGEIAGQTGSPSRGFSAFDTDCGRPWDEADEFRRFVSTSYWDSFLMLCPIGYGFRAEINALITFLRGRNKRLLKYKSQYGEVFLVQWALFRMPPPISKFLNWSLHQEEQEEDLWTIHAFEQHLLAWASLFDGDWAKKYYNDHRYKEDFRYETNCFSERTEQEFFPAQLRTGGGPIAHFLYSKPEHRRYAYQMFKMVWFNQFELLAIAGGGISSVNDTRMIGSHW